MTGSTHLHVSKVAGSFLFCSSLRVSILLSFPLLPLCHSSGPLTHIQQSSVRPSLPDGYFYLTIFIDLLLAALDLCCCMQTFSSGEQGHSFVGVDGLLTAVASPVAKHRL